MVGRPIFPVPLPAAGFVGGIVKRAGLADFSPDQMQFLAFGRGLDTTRMREVLRFEPRYSTRAAPSRTSPAHVGRGPAGRGHRR